MTIWRPLQGRRAHREPPLKLIPPWGIGPGERSLDAVLSPRRIPQQSTHSAAGTAARPPRLGGVRLAWLCRSQRAQTHTCGGDPLHVGGVLAQGGSLPRRVLCARERGSPGRALRPQPKREASSSLAASCSPTLTLLGSGAPFGNARYPAALAEEMIEKCQITRLILLGR